jgi:ATP-binding cassette subfamily B protein
MAARGTGGKAGADDARWRHLLALLPAAGWPLVAGVVAASTLSSALPLLVIAASGRLIGQVAAGAPVGEVAGPLAVLACLFGARQVFDPLRATVVERATSRIDGALRARVMAAASAPAGVAVLEEPAVVDLIEAAAARPGPFRPATPGGAAVAVVGLAGRYAQGAGAALLISRVSVWLAVVMFVGTLLYRRPHHREQLKMARAFDAHIPAYRRAGYMSSLLIEPPAAKEVRVFGLTDWLLARHTAQWSQVTGSMSAQRRRLRRRLGTYYVMMAPLNALAFLWAGWAAAEGRVDLGTLAVVLQASLNLLSLGGLGAEEAQIDFGTAALPALASLEQRAAAAVAAEPPPGRLPAAGMPERAVVFEGVCFSYPDGRPVFEGLDLVIEAGEALAVVGVNGAGKTTLLKLLTRLYEPSAGRILVDGVDLRDLDPGSWRDQVAVIFQDFLRYELDAAANVGFGCVARAGDTEARRRAAARAGALAMVEALPAGWATPLSRAYQGGADLSGGQWQRVALARALMAVECGARVLALDEPTANLDVRAEAQLFDDLLDVLGERGPAPAVTTLLVSHRFSTVRRAQRTCVIDRGAVVELGTHAELMAAGGLYARMFNLQASRFDG